MVGFKALVKRTTATRNTSLTTHASALTLVNILYVCEKKNIEREAEVLFKALALAIFSNKKNDLADFEQKNDVEEWSLYLTFSYAI